MNLASRVEYVSLRLIRRYLLKERTANRLQRWLPYYRSSLNETEPQRIVAAYSAALSSTGTLLHDRTVLELGAGRTNAVAYGLVAAGARQVIALEPYVAFDAARDRALLQAAHPGREAALPQHVTRVDAFGTVPDGSVDLVLSNSVLEHVMQLEPLFVECRRVLRPAGAMLHVVDYRDHFFKYPYAFLTFSERTWSRWLNPGDLPRWRIDDHVRLMERSGFSVRVLAEERDAEAFASIRRSLAAPFAEGRAGVDVTRGTLYAQTAR